MAWASSVFVIAGRHDRAWAERVETAVRRLDALASRVDDAAAVAVVLSTKAGASGSATVDLTSTAGLTDIGIALRRGVPVVPVLVGGAQMSADDLPEAVRDLAFRQGLELPDERALPVVAARLVAAARTAELLPTAPSSAHPDADPTGVFISYRRDDSTVRTERLARELAGRLGPQEVFFDVGSIAPGIDFRHRIRDAIGRAAVFVLVIGPGFLERDARGGRRIDRSSDVVRFEIRTALDRNQVEMDRILRRREPTAHDGPDARWRFLTTHVVRVGGAEMPSAEQLPEDIAALAGWPHSDGGDVAAVARHIIRSIALSARKLPPGHPAFRAPWSASTDGPTAPRGPGEERRVPEIRSATASARLAELGWAEQPSRSDGGVRLVHPQFPRHQFLVRTGPDAHLTLEQRTWAGSWAPTAKFSLSFHRRDAYAASLEDGPLEAAVDPERFVERLGREVVVDLSGLITFEGRGAPHPSAIEPYQRTRRLVTAAGGVPRLHHEHSLGRGTGVRARALEFAPRGGVMVVATERAVDVVDVETWSTSSICRMRGGWDSVDISPQGLIALGSHRGHVAVLDRDLRRRVELPRELRRRARRQEGPLRTVSWSSSGELLAVVIGRTILVVDLASGEVYELPFRETCEGPTQVLRARFLPGSRDLLVADGTNELSIMEALSGEVLAALTTSHAWEPLDAQPSSGLWLDIESTAVGPDGDLVAAAGSDGQIAIAHREGLEVAHLVVWSDPRARFQMRVEALAFSPDGRRLAAVADDHQLIVGDLATTRPVGVAALPRPDTLPASPCVAWSPDSRLVAAVSFAGTVDVWST